MLLLLLLVPPLLKQGSIAVRAGNFYARSWNERYRPGGLMVVSGGRRLPPLPVCPLFLTHPLKTGHIPVNDPVK